MRRPSLRPPYPLRVRLVASFLTVMALVLTVAGGFVYWRVRLALDGTLNSQLTQDTATLARTWATTHDASRAMASLPVESLGQILSTDGHVMSSTPAASTTSALLPAADLQQATSRPLRLTPGTLLSGGKHRLRLQTRPLAKPDGGKAIAVVAIRIGQRDEALRELLAQLTLANLAALTLAGAVAYRLTHKALDPVEHYRQQADAIAAGDTDARITPGGSDDEISRLGRTLNHMLDAQHQAAQQQRQFLADASHELRTPLAAIKTEVDLALRRDRDASAYRDALTNVGHDTDRLIGLAEQLLDLERGTQATGADSCDTAPVIGRSAARAKALLPPGRHLRVDLPATPRSSISEQALDQVVTNLITNAITHGQGDITVRLQTVESTPSFIRLTVHDTGQTLEPDFIPAAIDRFRRQDTARTVPGSGLGLALVHQLIRQAGGELRLCTQASHHRYPPRRYDQPCDHPDHGTTASALIPLHNPGSTP